MGRLHIVLNDKVETALRKRVNRNGFKKGNLSEYIEELIIKDLKIKK